MQPAVEMTAVHIDHFWIELAALSGGLFAPRSSRRCAPWFEEVGQAFCGPMPESWRAVADLGALGAG
jgi:hypothetical protein